MRFYFGNASMYRLIATFIIFLLQFLHLKLLNMRVSQVMKNMYLLYRLLEITLCKVTIFLFLVVIIGTLLSYGIFYIHSFVSDTPIDDGIFKSVSLGTFIILNAGAIAYPLLYVLEQKNLMLLQLEAHAGTCYLFWITKCNWLSNRTISNIKFKFIFICFHSIYNIWRYHIYLFFCYFGIYIS